MKSRIPAYDAASPDGMLFWFAEMSVRGLLFHPEEDPAEITCIETGERIFTDTEADSVRRILDSMFTAHGDATISACYPIFMKAVGQQLDA